MYAVVRTGGKQYKVAEGDSMRVERIEALVGDTVELDSVCLLARDDALVVDPEALKDTRVVCRIMAQDRGKKVRVFKKKRRKGYVRTQGHRQAYTELKIEKIQA